MGRLVDLQLRRRHPGGCPSSARRLDHEGPRSGRRVSIASGLPWLLFSLVSGAIADRVDRRLLMGRVQLLRFFIAGGLGVIAVVDWNRLPVVYALAFLLGTAETLFDNAAQAIMPAVVHPSRLEQANGRLFASEITANEFAGPPVGGYLFTLGTGLPFFVDAATFGISGALVLSLRGRFASTGREGAPPTKLRHDIAEGLTWAWGTMPLGAALGGLLAELFGLRAPFLVATVVIVVMGVAAIPIVNSRTVAEARAAAEAS